ncbi:MAG: PGN_0703 family putative restriction endonuclease [Bacteroidota bacterium]
MNNSAVLREKLKQYAVKYCIKNQITNITQRESAIIFNDIADNFHPDSYDSIIKNPAYKNRLDKIHTHFYNDTKELQSSNSSDALLMNIFCHPKVKNSWKGIKDLFNLSTFGTIEFGFNPKIEVNTGHHTEIDMKISDENQCIICEAKLTESDFTNKDLASFKAQYPSADGILNLEKLETDDGTKIDNYQLIRNIIAADKYNCRFILILHSERTDLIRKLYIVKDAVTKSPLRDNISFITWQEIANVLGKDIQDFLKLKYGI